MMGHKKESKVYTQHSRIHYHPREDDHWCKYQEKGVNILHKWSRGRNVTTPKYMSTVRGCDAPKYDTRVCTRTKTSDRIPGMLKIKGPELKRA